MKKIFFHVDVNSAYLSWESVRRLREDSKAMDLREIPSAIIGDPSRRSGIILAKSSMAKKFGVKTGEPVNISRKKCPLLYTVPADFDLYVEQSNLLMKLLKEYSPNVYQYSIDEAFIDMSGTGRLFGEPISCANRIRERIRLELGFTVNIGIGNNMATAKMAGEFSKPDKTHTLFEDEIEEKLWKLPIEDLFFVGRKSSMKLKNMGIYTIGDLAKMDIEVVRKKLNKYGEIIHNHANGKDGYEFLKNKTKNKSIGNSMTAPSDICDTKNANLAILSLCETVCARLRKRNMKAMIVSIELVDSNFNRYHKQKKMKNKSNEVSIIYHEAVILFEELWNGKPLRHIGISTGKVDGEIFEQMNFFDKISSKEEKLYKALDSIREKYGEDSVQRAVFIDNYISHMEGGTSKKKKNGIIYL